MTIGRAVAGIAVGAMLVVAAATPGRANDRPYLITTGAVQDDDDEGTWAFEAWAQRAGSERALTLAPAYMFTPGDELQLLWTRIDDRSGGAWSSTLEFEFKHVFNDIARDGYGIGYQLSLQNAKPPGGAGWRADRPSGRLLLTLPFQDGAALIHLNAGIGKSHGDRREWVWSAVAQQRLPWSRATHAFVEAGREERRTLLHGGVRHWLKKERFAVDVSLQQLRSQGTRASGLVIGAGWYDF